MKVIRKNDNCVQVGSLKPGSCILSNKCEHVLLVTSDVDYGMVTCVSLENGACIDLSVHTRVRKVNVTATVED